MDIRKCSVCKREFDFDETGFQEEVKKGGQQGGKLVCSEGCASTLAAKRGTRVVIQDENDAVIARNWEPGGTLRRPRR